jgi:AraC family transcriptional regulator of adaptative response / methylphosphotriester-DNA alkyltransferase methyltransferase
MTDDSEKSMWQAVIDCDSRYDGRFYYGVTTTGIFCRPSCKSRPPSRVNVRYFHSPDDAGQAGFRPCKRCRPDIASHDPSGEAIQAACIILDREFANPAILAELPGRVGLSRFHLSRLFKARTGLSPHEYLQDVRIRQAQRLLATNTLTATRVALEVGFNSPARFFAVFRARTALSPGIWQRQAAAERAAE